MLKGVDTQTTVVNQGEVCRGTKMHRRFEILHGSIVHRRSASRHTQHIRIAGNTVKSTIWTTQVQKQNLNETAPSVYLLYGSYDLEWVLMMLNGHAGLSGRICSRVIAPVA